MEGMKDIVLFDFDGTLIKADSFLKFAQKVCGRRRFCVVMLMYAPLLVGMLLRLVSRDVAKQRLFAAFFGGMRVEDFRRKGEAFAADLDKWVNRPVLEKAKEAQRQGRPVYIVTASIEDWVRPWCEQQGFLCIGTRAEVDAGGQLTGAFAGRNCRGEEKVLRVVSEILPHPRTSYHIVAYGDSEGDRELLEWADEGHLVKD